MAEYKKERRYTVTEYYDNESKKSRPALRIRGDWLAELGFVAGRKVNVSCEAGKITLTLADEILQE